MKSSEEIKESVKEIYTGIASQSREDNATSCCGVGGCATVDHEVFAEDYTKMKGYAEDADLGLGCGIPTQFAQIDAGQTVLDLGSGAGNDCFVARELVGPSGKVIGVDMTDLMIEKARINADKLGFNNVEFRKGDIEALPLAANTVDVVVSNCVLNLVPNKAQAFKEMFRVIKTGGHFSISDVVIQGDLPESVKQDAELYAGCVSGAIQKDDYLRMLEEAGFKHVEIKKEKEVILPESLLSEHLSETAHREFKDSKTGIFSITVYGKKEEECCGTGCC